MFDKSAKYLTVLIFAVLIFTFFIKTDNILILFLLFAVNVFALIISRKLSVQAKNLQKIYKILNDDCDPEKFLAELNEYAVNYKPYSQIGYVLNIDRAVAFINMGSFEEAKNILVSAEPERIQSKPARIIYYNNLCWLHVNMDNLEEARKCLPYFDNINIYNKNFRNALKSTIAELKRKEGNLEESRRMFSELLQTKLQKASYLDCIYRLALIDIAEQKTDEAKKALGRIVMEGNKLHIVDLAMNELKKLETYES